MNKEYKLASKNPSVKMVLNLVVIINENIANNSQNSVFNAKYFFNS